MAKRKAVVSIQDCVACGCCIKSVQEMQSPSPTASMPIFIRTCASGAENVRRNVPQVLLHWGGWVMKEKELV